MTGFELRKAIEAKSGMTVQHLLQVRGSQQNGGVTAVRAFMESGGDYDFVVRDDGTVEFAEFTIWPPEFIVERRTEWERRSCSRGGRRDRRT